MTNANIVLTTVSLFLIIAGIAALILTSPGAKRQK